MDNNSIETRTAPRRIKAIETVDFLKHNPEVGLFLEYEGRVCPISLGRNGGLVFQDGNKFLLIATRQKEVQLTEESAQALQDFLQKKDSGRHALATDPIPDYITEFRRGVAQETKPQLDRVLGCFQKYPELVEKSEMIRGLLEELENELKKSPSGTKRAEVNMHNLYMFFWKSKECAELFKRIICELQISMRLQVTNDHTNFPRSNFVIGVDKKGLSSQDITEILILIAEYCGDEQGSKLKQYLSSMEKYEIVCLFAEGYSNLAPQAEDTLLVILPE